MSKTKHIRIGEKKSRRLVNKLSVREDGMKIGKILLAKIAYADINNICTT